MKKAAYLIILFLLTVRILSAQKVINNPTFEARCGSLFNITGIELSPQQTRVFIHAVFHPNWWVKIYKDTYFEDVKTKEKFYPTHAEGIKFGEKFYVPSSGEADFTLIYPPLPQGTTKVNWKRDNSTEVNHYGISLVQQKKTKKQKTFDQIKGNWLRTDGTNNWAYGFYDSLAVIDAHCWKYKNIEKKRKALQLTLENQQGEIRQLKITLLKDGNCQIQTNQEKEILSKNPAGKKNYSKTQALYKTPFFHTDTAHIRGYLKGYDPRLGFSTGIIYIRNEITREDYPTVLTIHPDGRFEADFLLHYPVQTYISLQNAHIGLYIQPGETLFVYLDMEDFLARARARDSGFPFKETRYMGPSAQLCRELNQFDALFEMNLHAMQTDQKELTPAEFKEKQTNTFRQWRQKTDSIASTGEYTPEAIHFLKNKSLLEYANVLFNFLMNRDFYAREDTTNTVLKVKEDKNYYDFLRRIPLNDSIMLSDDNFKIFINRLEYMDLFDDIEPDSFKMPTAQTILKEWKQKEKLLQEASNCTNSLVWQMVKVRSYPFEAKRLSDQKQARILLDSLSHTVQVPLFISESERIYDKLYPAVEKQGYELPAGKASEIFRKIIEPYKGKILFIDFWATSCGPCRYGIEHMAHLRAQYKNSKDFQFIYITSEEESPENAYNKYVEENLKGEVLFRLPTSDYHYLRELFHFNGIPRYVLIDRDGKVLDDDYNSWLLESYLKKRVEK